MSISSKEYFQNHPGLQFHEGVFYQNGFKGHSDFVSNYLSLRQKEGRLYEDDMVLSLPEIPRNRPLSKEWTIRKRSADRLIKNLKTRQVRSIVEIGCGNGWFIQYLFQSLRADCIGIDINEAELKQAARLFGNNEKITFVCADIDSPLFRDFRSDIFILASVIQYFPDLNALLKTLLTLLTPGGEIHILDSPMYRDENLVTAATKSKIYFEKAGQPQMKNYYFHHPWKSFQSIDFEVLYDPASLSEKVKRVAITDSPFPWIKITKS